MGFTQIPPVVMVIVLWVSVGLVISYQLPSLLLAGTNPRELPT